MRKLAFLVALATSGALFGFSPASAQTDTAAFCQAALKADALSTKLFSGGKKPSQKDQQALDAAFTQAENTAPPEVAANVQAAVNEVRNALQSGKEPDESVIEPNTTAIDQYRYNSCGYPTADVAGIEYEFQGLPKTVQQEIARRLTELTDKARSGTLAPADVQNGTFSISNHGVSGSLLAAPIIINQPHRSHRSAKAYASCTRAPDRCRLLTRQCLRH